MAKRAFRLWCRKDRGGTFYFALPGEPWVATGHTDKTEAEKLVAAVLAERRMAAVLGKPVPQRSRGVTLGAYAAPFYVWKYPDPPRCPRIARRLAEGRQVGPEHAARQRRLLERFLLGDPESIPPIPPDALAGIPMAQIRRGDVQDFRARLIAKLGAGSGATVNATMSALSAVFAEAEDREELDRNPARRLLVAHTGKQRDTFTLAELRKMFPLDVTDKGPWDDLRAKVCFMLAGLCGLRRNEVRALRWGRVDLENRRLVIDSAVKGQNRQGAPKWNKTRETGIPGVLARHLTALGPGAEDALVIAYADGAQVGPTWWENTWRRAMKKLKPKGNRNLVPHCLRHSLATEARAQGISDALLRGSFGWTSQGVTDRYAGHASDTGARAVADVVDKLLG